MITRPRLLAVTIAAASIGCAAVAGFEPVEYFTATDAAVDEGVATEAGPFVDSGAPDARDAGTGCDAPPKSDFCDDFEKEVVFDAGAWTSYEIQAPGNVERVDGALHSSYGADGGSSTAIGRLFLVRTWPDGGTRDLVIRFRMFIEVCPQFGRALHMITGPDFGNFGSTFELYTAETDGQCRVSFGCFDNDTVPDGGYLSGGSLPSMLAVGVWHDVRFELHDTRDGTIRALLQLDGETREQTIRSAPQQTQYRVNLGAAGPESPGRMIVDDFRLDD